MARVKDKISVEAGRIRKGGICLRSPHKLDLRTRGGNSGKEKKRKIIEHEKRSKRNEPKDWEID